MYRGVFAYCSGCERPRPPFSATALNIAGRPSKLGGTLGKVLGWCILIGGLSTAATIVLVSHLLAPASAVGYAIGIPIAVLSLAIGIALLYGSRRLHQAGTDAERQAREQALYALAVNRGGLLTALDAARSLNLSVADVDAVLSDWAKRDPEHVSLEVDDEGQLFYLFSSPGRRLDTFGKRYRVEPEGRVRVEDVVEDEAEDHELARESLRRRNGWRP